MVVVKKTDFFTKRTGDFDERDGTMSQVNYLRQRHRFLYDTDDIITSKRDYIYHKLLNRTTVNI